MPEGLRRLAKRGDFKPPPSATELTHEHRLAQSSVQAFADEMWVTGKDDSVDAGLAYVVYRRWCELRGRKALSASRFPPVTSREVGVERSRTKKKRIFKGVSWRVADPFRYLIEGDG